MSLLERKAAQEIELYLEMGTNDSSFHDILVKSKQRLTLIQEKISEYEETLQEEQLSEKSLDTKQIIYLKSKSGNIFFEDDLNKLEPSSYNDFKKAFSLLSSGDNFFVNSSKMKDLINNESLRGVKECKDFQARIFYMHLIDNYVLVIMGDVKKADDPKLLRERLIARRKLALEYKPKLLLQLRNPKERTDLIAENNAITERIDEKISGMKRGK